MSRVAHEPLFHLADVVRLRGDARERTVLEDASDAVRCVYLAENGRLDEGTFPAAGVELVHRQPPPATAFRPGDVAQLPNDGRVVFLTVERAEPGGVFCYWWGEAGLLSAALPPGVLWLHRPTHDATARVETGEQVWLRGGGPWLTVTEGGTGVVRCVHAGGAAALDARALRVDGAETRTAQELLAFGRGQGVDLGAAWRDQGFWTERRFICFLRQTWGGVVTYSLQGFVTTLPADYANSASAFRGTYSEGGYCADVPQAFAVLRAWLVEQRDADDLPPRTRLRHGIG